MRKLGKFLIGGAAGAVLLAVVLAFACLEGVDYRPYFQQPYYRETVERLQTRAEPHPLARGTLLAGFGRARLTPRINAAKDDAETGEFRELPLAGYGNRHGRPATGVHDDLFIKAVALRVGDTTGVLFGCDALIVPREVAEAAAEQLRSEFGLSREQLYFSATHTHCGPGGWGEGLVGEIFAGKFNPDARRWFGHEFVAAAREAIKDLRPAEYGHASFAEPELVRNRLVGKLGQVDAEFSLLVFQQIGGPKALIGSYAAHATVLSGDVMEFSGDYPGYWQRAVESNLGGMAVFIAGSVGSHGPSPDGSGFAGAERMGAVLAAKAISSIEKLALTNTVTFGIASIDVSLPELNTRITDQIRLRPWLSSRLLHVPASRSFVQALRLDDVVWVSTPCDYSGELALDTTDFMKVRGFRANITSFNGDYIGYVVSPRYYHLGGYEPRTMSFYGPYVPEYLDELVRKIALVVIEGGQTERSSVIEKELGRVQ